MLYKRERERERERESDKTKRQNGEMTNVNALSNLKPKYT